jgi:hypothetical protein
VRPGATRTTRRCPTPRAGTLALACLLSLFGTSAAPAAPPAAVVDDPAGAREAFLSAAGVFLNPRCKNCHPAGDQPLQGDDSHPHAMRVARGPAGGGQYAVKCVSCHQTTNLPGAHMPPGAPRWQLPGPKARMVFEGKTPGQLCRQLKDPAQNGGRSLAQIAEHVAHDPLVGWAWAPGDGRKGVPVPREEFARSVAEWIQKGAACPD